MEKKHLEIHSENILPIIKKWLYSDKDIFCRELISNAIDALEKTKFLRERTELPVSDQPLQVEIEIDKGAKTLKFIDTGIGMDAEEVQKYIAQIAFSGAEEFVKKYKTEDEKDQFIGHFGLGFYSAYMVADKVEINTLSQRPNSEPVFWSCDGSSEYLLSVGTKQTPGTEITLYINSESEEFLEEVRLNQMLTHYCSFLPYPIFLGEKQINTHEPLWLKPAADCSDEDYLEFYRYLYPREDDPLFWVHLNVDYPFKLKGILYFPKMHKDFDFNKNSVKLYCNRVFVSDNCKDLIPNYLMVLQGIIDSPDIPLNVSRSYLQMDKTVRQLASHISKKVSDCLTTLYSNDKDRFISTWADISPIIKLGVLEDEKFYERVKNILIWKTSQGQWTTAEEYLELYREKTKDKIFYARDEKHIGPHFLEIYKQKGIELLYADAPVDPYLMQFLERKLSPVKFQRSDAGIEDHLLDKDREKTILDASGKTEAAKLADFIRSNLEDDKIEVEAKSLASDALPGFIMLNEDQRRMRDYMQSMHQGSGESMDFIKKTFVVNTNNKLIAAVQRISSKNPTLAKELVRQTYDLALLSQREMTPATLNDFVNRTNHVLEQLATMVH
ncbi:MAG: molecular chaperone HtpG [Parachlamydiaceae bacterium]|nr:molecular chaperone HtpG [Parachlamydiaceae bacterium]